jgi:hypothetical protein
MVFLSKKNRPLIDIAPLSGVYAKGINNHANKKGLRLREAGKNKWGHP